MLADGSEDLYEILALPDYENSRICLDGIIEEILEEICIDVCPKYIL
jgi:hypothetical protein